MLYILSSYLSFATSDLLVILLPALEGQLVDSHHEMEEALLREALLMVDHEHMVVAGVR